MGYHNLINSPPRFYIDQFTYYSTTTGVDASYYEGYDATVNIFNYPGLIGLNPSNTKIIEGHDWGFFDIPTGMNISYPFGLFEAERSGYVAVLGHTLKGFIINAGWNSGDGSGMTGMYPIEVVNHAGYGANLESDGLTIFTTNTDSSVAKRSRFVQVQIMKAGDWAEQINSISWGMVYDCPLSPDMTLTMSHEWDGIKTTQTKGGSTLTNVLHHGPSDWGERKAWQVGEFPYNLSGRRIWKLKWSSIADTDMEPYSYYGNKYSGDTESDQTVSDGTANWFYDVLRLTNGGANSFIFSPDPGIAYYMPDPADEPPKVPELAICKFDMKTFSRKQTSFKRYSHSITVREVW